MTLELKNIGMIKEASVKIDGLTVIAGENDTGKSTLGKALYLQLISIRNIILEDKGVVEFYGYPLYYVNNLINQIFKGQMVEGKGKIRLMGKNMDWELDFLDSKIDGYPNPKYQSKQIFESIFIETPLVWSFTDFFRDIAQIESQFELKLDYPHLMKDLNFKLHIKSASDGFDIKKEVTDLMGGEFKKDEMGRYYFDKKGQRIELVNTATGIKYFGIFQILSQNNYLNKDTVLVLDEPEVHLHPKWQLEMAKIIVELVKNGVKILVNSHSPYMIEALELYSSKQKINNNFYLAEKTDDYAIISDVTDNLEPIYSKLAKPIQDLEEESLENFKW